MCKDSARELAAAAGRGRTRQRRSGHRTRAGTRAETRAELPSESWPPRRGSGDRVSEGLAAEPCRSSVRELVQGFMQELAQEILEQHASPAPGAGRPGGAQTNASAEVWPQGSCESSVRELVRGLEHQELTAAAGRRRPRQQRSRQSPRSTSSSTKAPASELVMVSRRSYLP